VLKWSINSISNHAYYVMVSIAWMLLSVSMLNERSDHVRKCPLR
jgi:hypothetical protein